MSVSTFTMSVSTVEYLRLFEKKDTIWIPVNCQNYFQFQGRENVIFRWPSRLINLHGLQRSE
jgi:hypothetical protein